jgi:hypothetical protein
MNSNLRKIASLAAVAALAGTGTASAATFGQPIVSGPSEHIPINFAAFKEPANKKLPKNYRIVKVHAELARGEVASTTLTAPKGFRIITIGIGDGHKIGAVVKDVHYSGKRSVGVKVYTDKNAVKPGETAQGTLYILARRA